MNETYRRILGLRAIRHYQDRPLEQEDLDRVLEAARWTGSSKNRQNWAVVVVSDGDQIERLATCGDFTKPLRAAPVAVALVEEPETYEFDTGRVAQNIMLAADALGMATCPITFHRDQDAAEVLSVPPGWRCRYAIALGYPAAEARPARFGGRRPIGELVHRDSFAE
ncbi:MAG: nitroreductase family protein [Actinomycetia bacterium]|nr:nitroreductase family protein [Actinomycetes bacterium]